MGEYLLISAIIVFIFGLITIAFQMLNHKFPSHKNHLTNHST